MRRGHVRNSSHHVTAAGFALLEVMVAVLILGTVTGVLATEAQKTVDATVRLRERAAAVSEATSGDPSLKAWAWGARIVYARWQAGRVLQVSCALATAVPSVVGVWCSGWLLGEWERLPGQTLELGPSLWEGRTGQELAIRGRSADGGWGPPWRLVVPDLYGGDALDLAPPAQGPAEVPTFESAQTAVHLLCQSTLAPTASWASLPVSKNLAGAELLLTTCGAGLCHLSVGERRQTWVAATARRLDVYF